MPLVKALAAFLSLAAAHPAQAADPPMGFPSPLPSPSPLAAEGNEAIVEKDAAPAEQFKQSELPPIEARTYPVKVVRRSNSNRVYLFDDVSGGKPATGRIILLKREAENIMAFRVLKSYPETQQFAARRVRRYGRYRILDRGEAFRAVEKIGDIALEALGEQDKADLKELEGGGGAGEPTRPGDPVSSATGPLPETTAYDPELDAGTSPPPDGAVDSDDARSEPLGFGDDDGASALTVDEVFPLDMNNFWLTAQFAFLRNNGNQGGSSYYAGGGLRYAITLGRMLMLRTSGIQDSLSVEGGLFYYKILNFLVSNDAYNVIPMVFTGRYTINLGEGFGLFFYGGMVHNRAMASSQATDEGLALLGTSLPAGGGGLIFRVGPNWDARVDLGIDMIGTGLMLRF
jgi:hypothetical protein